MSAKCYVLEKFVEAKSVAEPDVGKGLKPLKAASQRVFTWKSYNSFIVL